MADSYINPKKRLELEQSEIIDALPKACCDELAAVEFMEYRRWKETPCCLHCGDVNVYKMTDSKTGQRNARFLWRCRGCKKQYSVRFGTVFAESLLPLRHWCYAFWRISTSKKGVAALEIMRQCQISYKSALFMMHRVRWALAPDHGTAPKLTGIVEADETYVGGKPRKTVFGTVSKRGTFGTAKTPVVGVVQRGGQIRRRVVANVNGDNIKEALRECVDKSATVYTDESMMYRWVGAEFEGGHHTVNHSMYEYARDGIGVNTMESSFALVKRSIMGIYHNVSKEHLHRYISECDFRWNHRQMNDGERTALAIKSAEGKRLMYKTPVDRLC